MPEPEARTEAPPAPAPPAPPMRPPAMISPGGYVVLLVVLLIEGVLVHLVTKYMNTEPPPKIGLHEPHEEVTLGELFREFPADDAGFHKHKFSVEAKLKLNTAFDDFPHLKAEVEKRMTYLRFQVMNRIVLKKPVEDFFKPNFVDTILLEIRQLLNQELGAGEGGKEIVLAVFFDRMLLPTAR